MNHDAPAYLQLENRHTGEILRLSRHRSKGETWLELWGSLPAHREGPPLHIHHLEDEVGTIRRGTLSAVVGGRRIEAGAGQSVTLPRGVPHRWWNEGDELLVFDGSIHPGVDLDRYLQAVFEVMNAAPSNRPSLFYMAHLTLRHRRTQSVLLMPRPLQAILFRAVVLLGTILGRYRGTEWPGCPVRCTGAPTVATGDA